LLSFDGNSLAAVFFAVIFQPLLSIKFLEWSKAADQPHKGVMDAITGRSGHTDRK
jgi:hypothetical protein